MDSATASDVGSMFLARSRYLLATEYRTKLRCAVEALPPELVWWRPNDSSNSVGNLVLHLVGNLRQWVVSGLGGTPDVRKRAAEFATRDGLRTPELVAEIERTLAEVDQVLSTLTPAGLLEHRSIQGTDVTVFDAVLTVVQHFSHHLGQIIWIAKLHAPQAIQFVVDDGTGLVRLAWREKIRPPTI